jgi:hypothetical protein
MAVRKSTHAASPNHKWFWRSLLTAVLWLGMTGCQSKMDSKTDTKADSKALPENQSMPPVRTDSLSLSKKIALPWGVRNLRWIEAPRIAGRSDFGPTDTRLSVSFGISDSSWQDLVSGWGEPMKRRDLPLDKDLVNALLDSAWLSQGQLENERYVFKGTLYNPSPMAASWYQGVVAIRQGELAYLEFVSK